MDHAPPPLTMARCLEALIEPRPRTLAIICRLHLFIIAMSIFTTTCERNPFILASMLPFITWTCIWLSMISAQFLCTKACNLHHYIRVPSPLRLARAHKPLPFTRAFYTPVETRPTPPAGVMPGDRPVTATCPVQEKVFATSGRDIPLVGPEQQRERAGYTTKTRMPRLTIATKPHFATVLEMVDICLSDTRLVFPRIRFGITRGIQTPQEMSQVTGNW